MDKAPEPDMTSLALDGRAALASAALELVQAAQREIALQSDALDPLLYNRSDFTDCVKALLLREPRARLRILVNRSRAVSARAHRLLELARQMTTQIELRELPERQREHQEDLLIVDRHSLVLRDHPDSLRARCIRAAAASVKPYLDDFDARWEHAEISSELRQLHL